MKNHDTQQLAKSIATEMANKNQIEDLKKNRNFCI